MIADNGIFTVDGLWTHYTINILPKWAESTKRLYASSSYGGRFLSLAIL